MVAPATLSLRPCVPFAPPNQHKLSTFTSSPCPHSVHLQPSGAGSKLVSSHALRNLSVSPVKAVAVDSDQSGSSEPSQQEKPKRYYFLVANAKFMLDEEEHFKELMYERLRNFGERNREQDFWLVIEPKFLDKFPDITKRLKRPAVALVSTDSPWITFMKLRLDRVLANNFEADTLNEALASNPVDLQFDKPQIWTAPYPKYEFGWWEPFLPPKSDHHSA
ncbi:Ycf54-like protein [Rhynchospora pubera]|uniref:Ycf54-like protein n=1 Tax=Rhynchospora pubera TaxID=906938 RepID=A0AAV8CE78_9POAL|nr:Ycf54-like protein [Rhynchospora pubera]